MFYNCNMGYVNRLLKEIPKIPKDTNIIKWQINKKIFDGYVDGKLTFRISFGYYFELIHRFDINLMHDNIVVFFQSRKIHKFEHLNKMCESYIFNGSYEQLCNEYDVSWFYKL